MKKKIIIIDNSNISYSGKDINGEILRGTETSLILLAEHLVKKKFEVDFCTNIEQNVNFNDVFYYNKKNINKNILFDLAIAVSDCNQFDFVNSRKKVIFSVSNQPFEKFLRKKQFFSFIKHRPCVVTLCNYQFKKRSFLTSLFGKKMIPIAVDPKFLNLNVDLNYLPKRRVIYNIRSNRNLDWLINIWCNKIHPYSKNAELFITPDLIDYNDNLKNHNIFLRKITSRSDMIDEMREYRALTYIGHKSDIFTLTCEEAVKMCMPVVTFGIGSVSDRVKHNKTGFVVKNDQEFADYTLKILNDDNFYLDIKKKLHSLRHENNWNSITDQWVKNFLN